MNIWDFVIPAIFALLTVFVVYRRWLKRIRCRRVINRNGDLILVIEYPFRSQFMKRRAEKTASLTQEG